MQLRRENGERNRLRETQGDNRAGREYVPAGPFEMAEIHFRKNYLNLGRKNNFGYVLFLPTYSAEVLSRIDSGYRGARMTGRNEGRQRSEQKSPVREDLLLDR